MSTNTATSTAAEPVLEAVHLRKVFPLHKVKPFSPPQVVHAVEDASLALRPGRATALVGESWSGKTTVARLLARPYTPTAGTIRYREETVKARRPTSPPPYRRPPLLSLHAPSS